MITAKALEAFKNGAETETVITVDKSFLELELQPSEFYEKFKYNLK